MCVFWLSCTFGKGEWAEQNLTLGLQTAIVNLDTTHSSFTAQIAWFIPGTARPLCACKTLQSAPSYCQTRKVHTQTHSQTPISHTLIVYTVNCSISVLVRLYELLNTARSELNWCWTFNSGMLSLCWRHNSDSCFLLMTDSANCSHSSLSELEMGFYTLSSGKWSDPYTFLTHIPGLMLDMIHWWTKHVSLCEYFHKD